MAMSAVTVVCWFEKIYIYIYKVECTEASGNQTVLFMTQLKAIPYHMKLSLCNKKINIYI